MHDILFKQALILDGTGAMPTIGDVAIKNGKICNISKNLPDVAVTTVVADGLALMPGIIDSHTHFDAQITWDPWLVPSPALGVSTVVIGNCGFTIAPCK